PTSVPDRLNLPPESAVPPMTTARIASSSMNRPALLASAAMVSALMSRPASPANRPDAAYTVQVRVRDRTPDSLLAAGLMPVASSSMPSAVRRTTYATTANTPKASTAAVGRPSQNPEPSTLNGALVTVVIMPPVMSMATPRP